MLDEKKVILYYDKYNKIRIGSIMNKRKKLILFNNLFIGFIVVATLLMGVGYASISSTSLDIDGSLAAKDSLEFL